MARLKGFPVQGSVCPHFWASAMFNLSLLAASVSPTAEQMSQKWPVSQQLRAYTRNPPLAPAASFPRPITPSNTTSAVKQQEGRKTISHTHSPRCCCDKCWKSLRAPGEYKPFNFTLSQSPVGEMVTHPVTSTLGALLTHPVKSSEADTQAGSFRSISPGRNNFLLNDFKKNQHRRRESMTQIN